MFIGFIFADLKALNASERLLRERYGPFDAQSGIFKFGHTDYYAPEMGNELNKKFVSFKRLIPPQALSSIKRHTNRVESKFLRDNRRTINIDPGYLDLAKVVLASTKDFVHRIYIGERIYAEVTLFYKNKNYRSWRWTYPDFRRKKYRDFLNQVRGLYVQQIQKN